MNRRFTLNLGLRWEIVGGFQEVAGRMAQFNPAKPNPLAGGRPGAVDFADELNKTTFMDTNWLQLSPKFGFAYQFSNWMVMRGGYGINNMPPINNGFGGPSTIGYNGSISVTSSNTQLRFPEEPVQYLHDPYPSFQSVLPDRDPSIANGQGISHVGKDHSRLPYTQNWNIGFQFALPANTVLETNYIGNKGTNLPMRGFDNLNALPLSTLGVGNILQSPWSPATGIPEPFPGFKGTVQQALRPFPQFTTISQPFPYFGTSLYNALQVQLTRRSNTGFSYLLAYTWSKALGYGSDSAIDSATPIDPFHRRLDRAVTAFHIPHFFKATWIWELPFGAGKLVPLSGITNTLLGGWELSGIHQVRSGDPLQITTSGLNNPFGATYPDLVQGEKIVLNSDAPINFRGISGGTAYLNRAAFANPPVHPGGNNVVTRPGTLGPVLPNIRGPMVQTNDLTIMKNFRFGENRSFVLRATALNAFNNVNRANPITNITDPNFGQITGQGLGGRQVELAARFEF